MNIRMIFLFKCFDTTFTSFFDVLIFLQIKSYVCYRFSFLVLLMNVVAGVRVDKMSSLYTRKPPSIVYVCSAVNYRQHSCGLESG